ncbi:MAG TPA: PorV/PorQ family protein [Elusimicrobiales bacterium]|nr:PorV/PorQ family protein [Elusimicrobiales bacterium]
MKRASALILIAAVSAIPAKPLAAQTASNAASFLEIDCGARGEALGGAFTAIADDASSVFYNPAGPGLVNRSEVMVSHSQWLEGLWNEQVAYVHPVNAKLTVFAGITALVSPPLDKFDETGAQNGTFNAFDGALSVGAATGFGANGYIGMNVKTIYSEADLHKAFAYAGDAGVIQNIGALRLGFSIQNIGTQMKLYKEKFNLPRISRGGAALKLLNKHWLSAEVIRLNDGKALWGGGLESEFTVTSEYTGVLRFGYKQGRSKNTGSGISAGLGLKAGDISGDYAFSPFGELGATHRLTLNLKFGESRDSSSRPARSKPPVKADIPAPAPDPEPTATEPATATNAALEAADRYYSQKDYSNAAAQYAAASKMLPEDDTLRIRVFERQGQISLKGKNIPKARGFYLAAIQTAKILAVTDVNVVNSYLGLAYCFDKSANIPAAIKNYEKALELSTNEKTKAGIRKTLQRLKSNPKQ